MRKHSMNYGVKLSARATFERRADGWYFTLDADSDMPQTAGPYESKDAAREALDGPKEVVYYRHGME